MYAHRSQGGHRLQHAYDGLRVGVSNLQPHPPPGQKKVIQTTHQAEDHFKPVLATHHGHAGLPLPDLGLRAQPLRFGQVGRVGKNQVKAQVRHRFQQAPLPKVDRDTRRRGVVPCGCEGGGGKVGRGYRTCHPLRGQGQRDGPRAGAHIQRRLEHPVRAGHALEDIDQVLGFRTRDGDPPVDIQHEVPERGRPQDVLQRFPRCPAPQQRLEAPPFGQGERAVEVQVEMKAPHAENVCEQVFGVEPAVLQPLAAQVVAAGTDDVHDRPHTLLRRGNVGGHQPAVRSARRAARAPRPISPPHPPQAAPLRVRAAAPTRLRPGRRPARRPGGRASARYGGR